MKRVLLLAFAAMGPAFGQPQAIPFLETAPKVDGDLDAEEWRGALHFTDFKETSGRGHGDLVPPGLRTAAWVAETSAGLCVAFRCWHDQMSQMVTATKTHDGPVWADDSVEVFLDVHGTQFGYYHLIANAAGALYDAYNKEPNRGDPVWDSGAIVAGRLLTDGYAIEMMVPWTSLNLGLNRTGAMGLNLCRNVRYTVGRQSLFGEYHRPTTWQAFRLRQTGPAFFPVAAEHVEWSPLAGKNEVVGRFRNLTQAPLQLTGCLTIAQAGRRQENTAPLAIAAEGSSELHLPYSVTDQDTAHLRLALQDVGGKGVLTVHRIVQPRPLATLSLDTDVLLRGESPLVTVSFAVSKASAQDYAMQFDVRTPDGSVVLRRAVPPAARTRLEEALDLSATPPDAQRFVMETTVTNIRTKQVVFRAQTPLHLVASPWAGAGE